MTTKKTIKKKSEERRQENREFIELAKDLKEIILDHNQRLSELESLLDKVANRMGL